MQYEETPTTKTKFNAKENALKELARVGTLSILWYIAKRHKFGLIATWAVIATMLVLCPPLPQIILGLVV